MLYREIMAVCSEIHTKHIKTLCGQNVELLHVKLSVHIVTTGLCMCAGSDYSVCSVLCLHAVSPCRCSLTVYSYSLPTVTY